MKPHKVLIVEDTPYFQIDAARVLGELGIEIKLAPNETVAMQLIHQQPFGAVITDVDLSAGGGTTEGGFLLAERMKHENIDIPLILTSSFLNPERANRAYRCGVFRAVERLTADYLDQMAKAVLEALQATTPHPAASTSAGHVSRNRSATDTTHAQVAPPAIGIITALPQEFAAVKATLLNCREHSLPGQGAGRRYIIGRMRSIHGAHHSVVLALADMGNNVAATRAALLLEHFRSVNEIIMVGIAGGVPSPAKPEDHVRLGDVVISNKKGVVQYDMVKLAEIRACPVTPSPKLIEAVRLCEANELAGDRPWDDEIRRILAKVNWKKPHTSSDRLFASDDPTKLIEHPNDPRRSGTRPRVFSAPVASANELLKDPVKRDFLRDKFGVKAVEMEGSGIADATWTCEKGYLVIRGICDYCDSHKNDDWQHYAAAVAAGYTQTLIQSMF